MTPFKPTYLIKKTRSEIQAIAKSLGSPYKEVKDALALEDKESEVFCNDRYLVMRYRREPKNPDHPTVIWLSIRTHDRSPVTDWRDKQQIKNELVGPECEGIELYPAESRLVDTSNQFHLWCMESTEYQFPFGFNKRAVSNSEVGGSKQRKHENP
jgi:hypothetical protein